MHCSKRQVFEIILAQAAIGMVLAVGCYWASGQLLGKMLVKANGSSGIYHTTDCPNYSTTKIGNDENDRWFVSTSAAVAAGFERAKNCP